MIKSTLYRDLLKIIRTMESCTQKYQFEVAIAMFKNWIVLNGLEKSNFDFGAKWIIGNSEANQINEIANKFGYEFRPGWGDFIHIDNAKYEPLDEE